MLTNTLEPVQVIAAEPPIRVKRKLLNSLISAGSFDDFVNQVFWLAENKYSSYVCFANVHMLMEAKQDAAFSEVLNNADLAAPDGGPVSKLMKLLYGESQDRVPGMDLLPRLLQEAQARGKSVFFYGSTDDVLQAVAARANADLPDLRIAGTYSPPFRQLSEEEDQEIIRMINSSGADLVFVALGCPKQERWMAAHKGKVNACMLGVGQAYMTYAGLEKRLPQWARDLSLEWTYRLWQEPRRLWKRYLLTNSLFVFEVMKLLAKGKGRHSESSN
ncbi:WecB/TagA/CpsF family glycosyltransferase [Pontibacter akesuensis]|uniref:N-acetylglucosaminyldiphosphoundecaprenol N-acetyl-beta-D-mannosaminyltransferase n=1 Tax=Pontibacter akesuensis TaxID=388950 RepID=A0A1I7KIL6_9BACT|nr:WecB/TagA/CpsF family glycosyltransferase [Pontibacter akesuensis]GHA80227.1 glycosyl transferase [Pontibacter akesuensis]SFU97252.1 N-acetylglucosaminyldiphosphoundecaprenol N-acetyl-beta-D-mannosaminyltransferase [Pontibacter akesuensis]